MPRRLVRPTMLILIATLLMPSAHGADTVDMTKRASELKGLKRGMFIPSAKIDEANDIVPRHFKIQIRELADLDKIKMPLVTHHEAATQFRYEAMCRTYDGIMPVKKVGQTHIWFSPWDYLIRWWGVEEAMLDLIERPELVHAGVERMVDAWMTELDQFEALNALSLDSNNTRIGSGGYGYTRDLPGEDFDPACVHPHNMWGCSNA